MVDLGATLVLLLRVLKHKKNESHENFTQENLPEIQKYSLKISITKISKMLGNLVPQGSQKFMTPIKHSKSPT